MFGRSIYAVSSRLSAKDTVTSMNWFWKTGKKLTVSSLLQPTVNDPSYTIKDGAQITSLWTPTVPTAPQHLITGLSHNILQYSLIIHKNSMEQSDAGRQGKEPLASCLFALTSGIFKGMVSIPSERMILWPLTLPVDPRQEWLLEWNVKGQLLFTVFTQTTA